MRIVLTGGETGGHFYPLIAIAESIRSEALSKGIAECDIRFLAPKAFDDSELSRLSIKYSNVPAGKLRIYFSPENIIAPFLSAYGIIIAFFKLLAFYPDIIVSKGGYGSFPVVMAGRLLRIPILIHESDTVPGRSNVWAGKFATRIAISFQSAGKYFDPARTALTGQPMRHELLPDKSYKPSWYKDENRRARIIIVGGSQGSKTINDAVLPALPELLNFADIVHQTGTYEKEERNKLTEFFLNKHAHREGYRSFDFLPLRNLSKELRNADLVISRSGSFLFEISAWGKPAILIPIAKSNGNHQVMNAYAYADAGATTVIEEMNLTPNLLVSETKKILENKEIYLKMSESATAFADTDAAEQIAREIIHIALQH